MFHQLGGYIVSYSSWCCAGVCGRALITTTLLPILLCGGSLDLWVIVLIPDIDVRTVVADRFSVPSLYVVPATVPG